MDSIETREKNAKALDLYYKKEARLNRRADLMSQLFLMVLLSGFFIYFSTTVLIAKSIRAGHIETAVIRTAQLHVVLIMLNFLLIKRSKRLVIPFYIILAFIIPSVYYIYIIDDRYYFYIIPAVVTIIAFIAGLFIWKKNRNYIEEKKNKWTIAINSKN